MRLGHEIARRRLPGVHDIGLDERCERRVAWQRVGNAPEQQREHGPFWPQDRLDKVVGFVAALLGIIVVAVSVLPSSKAGLLGPTGVLLGVIGYLLGARWLGGATIFVSAAAILAWMLA